jgi:hypothetical protein
MLIISHANSPPTLIGLYSVPPFASATNVLGNYNLFHSLGLQGHEGFWSLFINTGTQAH